ncbi:unnamed protein product [Blepharisma stoltei]|uniref:non-specific serine/threonine protein kinase n=1 Tax=Blepharisma stoltei TaxID=1481888 RepID=A0AAU9J8Z3_9CILI|nr:unnamed protein product [Blepharisma stoltei]
MRNEWEREKFQYFQNFKTINYVSKGPKNLMIVEFTDKTNPNFPKIAVLKEFKSVNPRCEKEAKLLDKWSELHPNIVKPYYFTEIDGKFRIFIEYCECGSLSKLINERKIQNRPWSDSELINHFITIAEVINCLHEKDCVHRDIKPDNIFVKAHEVLKIGDFGDAKEIHIGESKFEALGTLQYMSPHLKKIWGSVITEKTGNKISSLINPKMEEVWSVGKTFYEMASLNLAKSFPDDEDEIIEMMIADMESRPRRLINLLIWMLKNNYNNRPNICEVMEVLHNIKDEIAETDSDSQSVYKNQFNIFDLKSFTESNGSSKTISYEERKSSKGNATYRESDLFENETNLSGFDSKQTKEKLEVKKSDCDNIYTHECGLKYDKDEIANCQELIEEDKYYQDFEIKDYIRRGDKGLTTVHFKSQGPPGFPKIAVLIEFSTIKESYLNEAKLLKKLSDIHPNIVKYYYSTEIDGKFRIFMEHCECGTVARIISEREKLSQPWTDCELINHFITIAEIIKVLHDNNYAHRDIKPDNIFVKEKEVLKLGDFGDSNEVKLGPNKNTATGTPIYMSPPYQKIWNSLKPDADGKKRTPIPFTKQEEVWSVGKTFYEMAVLEVGVSFPNKENEYMEIVENDMRTRPQKLVKLLKWMLRIKYEDRPTIAQVLEELLEIKEENAKEFWSYFEINEFIGSWSQNDPNESFGDLCGSDWRYYEIPTNAKEECNQDRDIIHDPYTRSINGIEQSAKMNTIDSNDDYFIHDCGLMIHRVELQSYIKTCLRMGLEFPQINCLNCFGPFPIEIYKCLKASLMLS